MEEIGLVNNMDAALKHFGNVSHMVQKQQNTNSGYRF